MSKHKIISIAIQKGGSGKTTTAINLAAALAREKLKVLLIDFDPQANLSQALGITEEPEKNIYHVIHQAANGEQVNLQKFIVSKNDIDFIPASLDLAAAELELVSIYGREIILKNLLENISGDYDQIIIDCPPSIGLLTVNALVASHFVIMPLQAEFLPLKGMKSFINHFKKIKKQLNPKLEILGFLLTKFDPRKTMNRQVQEQMTTEFRDKVFKTRIRSNIALAQAQERGVDIFTYDRSCHGAADYQAFAAEFLQKMQNTK